MKLLDTLKDWFAVKPIKNQAHSEPIVSTSVTQQDKNIIPVGSILDKTVVASILSQAHNGDTRKLHTLYDEMLCDSHISAEYQKIKSLITQSPFELLPYPPSVMKLENQDSEDYARAIEIRDYIQDQLTDPDVHLTDAISHLLWGLMTSVSGIEPIVEPKGHEGNKEKLVALNLIPSTRYRYPNLDTDLAIQTGDDPNLLTPVADLGTAIVTIQADSHIASPARRGVFRRIISPWLIRRYAPEWWSRNVELFGIGTRVAKAPTEAASKEGTGSFWFSLNHSHS
jgi:phage gp29-like protein